MDLSTQTMTVRRGLLVGGVSSNTIFLDTALLSPATATSWESALTSAMTYYGSPAKVGAFLDWWPGARRWLEGVSTLSTRLNVIYAAGADSFVRAYTARQGVRSPLGLGGVCAELGMSPGDLLTKISGSSTGIGRYFSGSGSNRYLLASAADTLRLLEHDIYGSSRVGVQRYEDPLTDTVNGTLGRDSAALARYETIQDYYDSTKTRRGLSTPVVWYGYWYGEGIGKGSREAWGHGDTSSGLTVSRVVGRRYYELSDHLGNVLATVLDRKTGMLASGSTTLYDRWKADVVSATDYYPFGWEMPSRTYTASIGLGSARFGFNGKMKENEIAGNGNTLDFGARMYTSILGEFLSIDPDSKKYPALSPYAFAANSPIVFIDIEGKGPKLVICDNALANKAQIALSNNDVVALAVIVYKAVTTNTVGQSNGNSKATKFPNAVNIGDAGRGKVEFLESGNQSDKSLGVGIDVLNLNAAESKNISPRQYAIKIIDLAIKSVDNKIAETDVALDDNERLWRLKQTVDKPMGGDPQNGMNGVKALHYYQYSKKKEELLQQKADHEVEKKGLQGKKEALQKS